MYKLCGWLLCIFLKMYKHGMYVLTISRKTHETVTVVPSGKRTGEWLREKLIFQIHTEINK